MKFQELMAVGIKVCGILLLFVFLRTISLQYSSLSALAGNGDDGIRVYAFITVIELFLILSFSIAFLKFPNLVARKLFPNEVELELDLSKNAERLISIACCILGIYILSWAIPDFINNALWILYFSKSMYLSDILYVEAIFSEVVTVVEIVIGSYLCLRSSGISALVWRVRGAASAQQSAAADAEHGVSPMERV